MAIFDEEEPVSVDYTEKIKAQVLAIIGSSSRLDHVEVRRHHNDNYRINVWEKPESIKEYAIVMSPRIRASYYLKTSDVGEIVYSNPPLIKIFT